MLWPRGGDFENMLLDARPLQPARHILPQDAGFGGKPVGNIRIHRHSPAPAFAGNDQNSAHTFIERLGNKKAEGAVGLCLGHTVQVDPPVDGHFSG